MSREQVAADAVHHRHRANAVSDVHNGMEPSADLPCFTERVLTGADGCRPESIQSEAPKRHTSSLSHLAGSDLGERPAAARKSARGGGGGWHKASVSDCLPLAAPIGLSPLLILTLCGPERVLVVSTEPPDVLSCLTTAGVGCPGDGAVARAVDQGHPDAHSESMQGLPTPALTCARWGVHLQDDFPDRGGGGGANQLPPA